jgi:hypothetical protein
MKEIIHADVFFFVTTVVVVVLGAIVATALIYAVSILADVKKISKKIKEGSEGMMEDFQQLRERFKNEGFRKVVSLVGFLGSFFVKKRKNTKSKE